MYTGAVFLWTWPKRLPRCFKGSARGRYTSRLLFPSRFLSNRFSLKLGSETLPYLLGWWKPQIQARHERRRGVEQEWKMWAFMSRSRWC
ncbi:hypothetical protein OIU77_025985 [Salix suchowensis]|uniref:Uncharacterized protein n=1 Tax=Salix suchowensis TaxID=1278906 RepID=A0ABQ9BZX6_9ROSI|nr:hypothetical protein OIU77_025985 [Salix suchowensis]